MTFVISLSKTLLKWFVLHLFKSFTGSNANSCKSCIILLSFLWNRLVLVCVRVGMRISLTKFDKCKYAGVVPLERRLRPTPLKQELSYKPSIAASHLPIKISVAHAKTQLCSEWTLHLLTNLPRAL